ncbi:MAG: hypothetical protein AB2A00_31240 [Myxococcota bacterium]
MSNQRLAACASLLVAVGALTTCASGSRTVPSRPTLSRQAGPVTLHQRGDEALLVWTGPMQGRPEEHAGALAAYAEALGCRTLGPPRVIAWEGRQCLAVPVVLRTSDEGGMCSAVGAR